MKRIFLACLLESLLLSFVWAQAQNKPFAELEEYVKTQGKTWTDLKVEVSRQFQKERNRLGAGFEPALWTYLGEDIDKYYWAAMFLESKAYLHGNSPLPELSFSIRQKALKLLSNKTDADSAIEKIRLLVMAAASGAELGKSDAAAYKREAETMIKANPDLKNYLPYLPDARRCFYENIGNTSKCRDGARDSSSGQTDRNSASVEDATTIVLMPKDANNQRVRGKVKVEVMIDEDGNPITAKAVEGPGALREAAVAFALQSKFTPAILNGRAVKVTRTVIYEFGQ